MITFKVLTVPVAQPRGRAIVLNGMARIVSNPATRKRADGSRVSTGINEFKAAVQRAAQDAYRGPPLDGPLILSAVFIMPRPKGMIWKTRDMPRVPHDKKPDCDNLLKAVKDSLSKLMFRDDSQVYKATAEKWIAAGDERPHVEVTITTWAELQDGVNGPALTLAETVTPPITVKGA